MKYAERTPTMEPRSKLSTKEEQIAEKKLTFKEAEPSDSDQNLLIRNIQHLKSSNTEKIWLWLCSRLQRKEHWLKEVLLRFFCGLCHHLAPRQYGYPAELCGSQVIQCTKCLTSFGLAKLSLCLGKHPDRGLNKREIHFNSCHFGGLQSSQTSCGAFKAVVTLREDGGGEGVGRGCRVEQGGAELLLVLTEHI